MPRGGVPTVSASAKTKDGLTQKQQQFIDEYLMDFNASAAARRAGYSQRSAREYARQLLANPRVSSQIEEAKKARQERVQMDQDYVLRVWQEIIEQCLTDRRWNPQAVCSASNMLAKHLHMLDGEGNTTNNVQFVFVGTQGKPLQECIAEHGVVEITQDD